MFGMDGQELLYWRENEQHTPVTSSQCPNSGGFQNLPLPWDGPVRARPDAKVQLNAHHSLLHLGAAVY